MLVFPAPSCTSLERGHPARTFVDLASSRQRGPPAIVSQPKAADRKPAGLRYGWWPALPAQPTGGLLTLASHFDCFRTTPVWSVK